jgi:hypothetical protein
VVCTCWPNQWFDQWLLGVLCTCLAQPMVVRPMDVGCAMYLFGPTNGGSTNGYWVFYKGTYLAQPMVVLTNAYWVFYVPIWHNQ